MDNVIYYKKGDLFKSGAQVLVNPVNTVGVMGKGLALSFKNRFPHMFSVYKKACDNRSFSVGKLMLIKDGGQQILLFPTKKDWRDPSKLEYIEKGLEKFVQTYRIKNITSVAFPPLGCGCGGLNWNNVKPIMEKYLNNITIDVYIYEPN